MGWDIETIGKHNLDTSSVEAVAKQLSKAWGVNIRYGYFRRFCIERTPLKIIEGDWNFICLGEIKCKTSDALYTLTDDNYSIRDILNQINHDLTCVNWGRRAKQSFIKNMTSVDFFELNIFGMHDYAEKYPEVNFVTFSLIFKESILISLYHDPFRWVGFIYNFQEDCIDCDFKSLNEFRWYLQHFFSAVGVSSIIYFPDQGPAQLILDELHRSWAEIEEYIMNGRYYDDSCNVEERKRRDLRRIIDIPSFIKSKKPEYSEYRSNIFTDDFSDIIKNYKPQPKERKPEPEPDYPYKFRNGIEELNWLYYGIAPSEDGDEFSFLED
ncbi:MAG: hypothetical protein PHT69_10540 [Bacteroidales bacterium]|nr:hypothetical protein [Bacteroidales bacterium]